jgi:hypothetical protein
LVLDFRKLQPNAANWLLLRVDRLFAMRGYILGWLPAPAKRVVRKISTKLLFWIDSLFDVRYGTDTGGFILLDRLGVDPSKREHCCPYEPTSRRVFLCAMKHIPISERDYTFIDFGSGKGRALLLASNFAFKEILGIEFSESLHRIAQDNILKYRSRKRKCKRIRSICMDAVEFPVPATNLVAYFYNPFDDVILAKILKNMPNFGKMGYKLYIVCSEDRSAILDNCELVPYKRAVRVPLLVGRTEGRRISNLNIYSNQPC